MDDQPSFSADFDDEFDVDQIPGDRARFGLDVVQGLGDGIRDFTEVREARWRRRGRSLGPGLLASAMRIDDPT